MHCTVIKHDRPENTRETDVENTSRREVFSTFLECSLLFTPHFLKIADWQSKA